MLNQFSRTEMLIGSKNMKNLTKMKVAIFGIGGVGSYVAEGLARSGIGSFILIDDDKVTVTNINRQIIATIKTIGKYKVDLMEQRILDINPDVNIKTYKVFYMPNCKEKIIDNSINYIVDAMDTVTAKIYLIEQAEKFNIPIISSMGTGNKLDGSRFEIKDIYETSICPLAKIIRKELRQRNIKKLKVIYSNENPIEIEKNERKIPGSISYVPSIAGLMIAGEIINDLIKN